LTEKLVHKKADGFDINKRRERSQGSDMRRVFQVHRSTEELINL